MRTSLVVLLSLLVVGAAEAKGRRGAYPASQRDARDRAPSQRGSAANPNPAFRPPTFGETPSRRGSSPAPAPAGSDSRSASPAANPYKEYESALPEETGRRSPAAAEKATPQPAAPAAPVDESEPPLPETPASGSVPQPAR